MSAFETMETVYTLDEAAKKIGIAPTTLRDWVTRGWVPHHRRGRVKGIYFTVPDVEAILRTQARPPKAQSPLADTSVPPPGIPPEFDRLRGKQ